MQGGGEVQALLTALAVHIIEGATGNAIVQALVGVTFAIAIAKLPIRDTVAIW